MTGFSERHYYGGDGLRLYYRDYPAPRRRALTVLCLPGLTRSSCDFEVLAVHLNQKYRVLAADFRGRGKSEYAANPASYVPVSYAKDVEQLLNHAYVRQVAVIGTSLGGIVAMLMAGIMRHRLAGVVLNDIGPAIEPAGLARIGGYVGKPATYRDWGEVVAAIRQINRAAYPDYQEEDWLRLAKRGFVERADGIAANYDPAIAIPFQASGGAMPKLWPFFEALAGIPTLAIRGGLSDILAAETLAEMQRRYPAIEAVTVARIGHAPNLDEFEALAAIDAFLPQCRANIGLIGMTIAQFSAARHATRINRALTA